MFVSVSFSSCKGAWIYLVNKVSSGSITLMQQRARVCVGQLAVSRSSVSFSVPGRDGLKSSFICREPFALSLVLRSGVKQKMGDTLFVLSRGGQLLQGLELVSIQLYLQKEEFHIGHRTAWICTETFHC